MRLLLLWLWFWYDSGFQLNPGYLGIVKLQILLKSVWGYVYIDCRCPLQLETGVFIMCSLGEDISTIL